MLTRGKTVCGRTLTLVIENKCGCGRTARSVTNPPPAYRLGVLWGDGC